MRFAKHGMGATALGMVCATALVFGPLVARAQSISSEPLQPPAGGSAASNYEPRLSAPAPSPSTTSDAAAPYKAPTPLASSRTATPPTSGGSTMLGHSSPGVADNSGAKHPPSGLNTPHKPAKKLASVKPKPHHHKPLTNSAEAKSKPTKIKPASDANS